MTINLNGIIPTGYLHDWTLFSEIVTDLPQDLDLALNDILKTYPLNLSKIQCLGCKIVNGTNYLCVAQRTQCINDSNIEDFISFIVNIPDIINDVEIPEIIRLDVPHEILLTDNAEKAFTVATSRLVGVIHTPLIELGFSSSGNAVNYHFICVSKPVYPDSNSYLSYIVINFVNGVYSVLSIMQC